MGNQLRSTLMLFMTAIIWGLAFVAQRTGAGHMGTFWFSTFRSLIGAGVLILIYAVLSRRIASKSVKPVKKEGGSDKLLIKGSIICGILIFLAMNMQQEGLATVDAGKASFLTALYIILVPIMGIFIKQKTSLLIWISALISLVGIYLLSIKEGFSIERGDLIVLTGSVFWAIHILAMNYFAPRLNAMKLTAGQFLVAGILSLIVAIFTEDISMEALEGAAASILYTGVLSTAVAFTLQTMGQKHSNPTVTAMVLSTEALWATFFGFIILGEVFTAREFTGSVLMFTAIILSQLPVGKLSGKRGR